MMIAASALILLFWSNFANGQVPCSSVYQPEDKTCVCYPLSALPDNLYLLRFGETEGATSYYGPVEIITTGCMAYLTLNCEAYPNSHLFYVINDVYLYELPTGYELDAKIRCQSYSRFVDFDESFKASIRDMFSIPTTADVWLSEAGCKSPSNKTYSSSTQFVSTTTYVEITSTTFVPTSTTDDSTSINTEILSTSTFADTSSPVSSTSDDSSSSDASLQTETTVSSVTSANSDNTSPVPGLNHCGCYYLKIFSQSMITGYTVGNTHVHYGCECDNVEIQCDEGYDPHMLLNSTYLLPFPHHSARFVQCNADLRVYDMIDKIPYGGPVRIYFLGYVGCLDTSRLPTTTVQTTISGGDGQQTTTISNGQQQSTTDQSGLQTTSYNSGQTVTGDGNGQQSTTDNSGQQTTGDNNGQQTITYGNGIGTTDINGQQTTQNNNGQQSTDINGQQSTTGGNGQQQTTTATNSNQQSSISPDSSATTSQGFISTTTKKRNSDCSCGSMPAMDQGTFDYLYAWQTSKIYHIGKVTFTYQSECSTVSMTCSYPSVSAGRNDVKTTRPLMFFNNQYVVSDSTVKDVATRYNLYCDKDSSTWKFDEASETLFKGSLKEDNIQLTHIGCATIVTKG